jgi:hypothetical protein
MEVSRSSPYELMMLSIGVSRSYSTVLRTRESLTLRPACTRTSSGRSTVQLSRTDPEPAADQPSQHVFQLRAASGILPAPASSHGRSQGQTLERRNPAPAGASESFARGRCGSGVRTRQRRARVCTQSYQDRSGPDDTSRVGTGRCSKIMLCAPTRMTERLPASISRSALQGWLSTTRPACPLSTPTLSSFPRYRCFCGAFCP